MKDFLHTLLILGFILPLIFGFLYALKYLLNRPFRRKSTPVIQMTHQLSIGAKERLLCVEIEGTRLLLGITPHTITTLHVFNSVTSKDLV